MFEKEVYTNRRDQLRSKIKSGVILLLGNVDSPMSYSDNTFTFRQDSSFLYFFGLDFQGLAGVIDVDNQTDFIFGNDVDMDDIVWMGPQVTIAENAEKVGVKKSAPSKELYNYLSNAIGQGRKIHFLPPYRGENKVLLQQLLGLNAARLNNYASVELIQAIVELRSTKEDREIAEMEKACAIGYDMHMTAMKMAKPGIIEQEIVGKMEGVVISHGGVVSFPTILSQNGQTLHNHKHNLILEKGRMIVVDAGAESPSHYASDFTRTIPVGGRFTPKQKEIYDIVLAANNKTAELSKPGVTFQSVHFAISEFIAGRLKDLGLMKGDIKEAVRQGAHALFFVHGIGHMIGLDVHDMEDLGQVYVGFDQQIRPIDQFGTNCLRMGRKLQPGFVVSDEPGIYFIPALIDQWQSEKKYNDFINYEKVNEYRNFGGIRVEDDLLITADKCRRLGEHRVPVTPEEIEATVNS